MSFDKLAGLIIIKGSERGIHHFNERIRYEISVISIYITFFDIS